MKLTLIRKQLKIAELENSRLQEVVIKQEALLRVKQAQAKALEVAIAEYSNLLQNQ